MTKRKLRYSGLGLAVLMVGAVAACSSDNTGTNPGGGGSGPKGGSSAGGSAGTVAAAGNVAAGGSNTAGTGTGGSSTAGTGTGGASAGFACANTMPACALITDGTNLLPHPTQAGNFAMSGAVEGGTYSYQPNALTLDSLSKTALNVKGNVKNYDGVGIYFNTCYDVKTLNDTGVSFSIKGNAGPTGMVNFRVQTNANTAYNDPVNASAKKGLCKATDPANAYPDCHAAGKDYAVTSTPTVITVNFADLTGGLPTAGVDGSDVVGIEWALAWKEGGFGTGGTGAGGAASGGSSAGGASGSGGASGGSAGKGGAASGGTSAGGSAAGGAAPSDGSYNVDITIDDVKFIGGPATATCTTGTGGSGAGGGSTGGASTGGGSSTAGSSSGGASGGTGGASGGAGGKAGSGG